jgi:diguanylate cyclase (GGDEF)-like protein
VRSTFGVAFVSALILTPFGINNFIQGRYILGCLTLLISLFCIINAFLCYRGQYHLGINLLCIAPAITSTIIFATYELGVKGSYWAFLVVLGLYFVLPKKWAWKANIIFVAIIIPVAYLVIEQPILVRFSSVLLGVSFFALLSMSEITKQHYLIKEKAITDPLTGVYNRSILQFTLEQGLNLFNRVGISRTLIMLDIDHFKKVNDELGHDVGDTVLKQLGKLLQDFFRDTDTIFRIGGEEFLVAVYNVDKAKALDIAEKLRLKIEQSSLVPEHTVTVSIGVASLEADIDWTEWMKRCDDQLYRAKSNGRNQVCA